MAVDLDTGVTPDTPLGEPAHDEWQSDKNGRFFIPRTSGVSGLIWRKDDETVTEARERDNAKLALKQKRDPKPGGKHAARSGPPKPSTADLEKFLAELLTAPAIPAKVILQCDYCMGHFITQGPIAAHQLAELSTNNPALRGLLEKMYQSWTAVTYGAVLAAYVGKPLLHHAAPAPILDTAGPFLGVPPRQAHAPSHAHVRYKEPNYAPNATTASTDSPDSANGTPPAS